MTSLTRNGARVPSIRLNRRVDIDSLAVLRVLFGLTMSFSTLRFMLSGWIEELFVRPTFFLQISWLRMDARLVAYRFICALLHRDVLCTHGRGRLVLSDIYGCFPAEFLGHSAIRRVELPQSLLPCSLRWHGASLPTSQRAVVGRCVEKLKSCP